MRFKENGGTVRQAALTGQKFWSNRSTLEQGAIAHQPREVGPINRGSEECVGGLIGGRDEYVEVYPHKARHS